MPEAAPMYSHAEATSAATIDSPSVAIAK